jgi:F0F1-type ATP synthase membrane subunit b/b'
VKEQIAKSTQAAEETWQMGARLEQAERQVMETQERAQEAIEAARQQPNMAIERLRRQVTMELILMV